MTFLFFLIRFPFFVAGAVLLLAVGIIALDIGLILGFVILAFGVPFWLVILFPGSIIAAAFSNDPQVIVSFLRWTRNEVIGEAIKWIRATATDYFKAYIDLGKWLVRINTAADGGK
jgi:hypothetical protein